MHHYTIVMQRPARFTQTQIFLFYLPYEEAAYFRETDHKGQRRGGTDRDTRVRHELGFVQSQWYLVLVKSTGTSASASSNLM